MTAVHLSPNPWILEKIHAIYHICMEIIEGTMCGCGWVDNQFLTQLELTWPLCIEIFESDLNHQPVRYCKSESEIPACGWSVVTKVFVEAS